MAFSDPANQRSRTTFPAFGSSAPASASRSRLCSTLCVCATAVRVSTAAEATVSSCVWNTPNAPARPHPATASTAASAPVLSPHPSSRTRRTMPKSDPPVSPGSASPSASSSRHEGPRSAARAGETASTGTEGMTTAENSPVAAAKTARSISGASSVAMGAFLPGVADILVSAFPRREEPRVGASDAPVRAARRVLSADRVRAAHPHEHARREHRTGVTGATRAVAVTTLIVSSNQSRASLFARRSASPARSRGGRGVWVSSAERSRAERARREDRERVEMSDAPLL
mmetsp:Transcript_183/g.724  ORF Transcript_183/g.724 Transcript_183/m.724 type:complete len:287 (+) Transcript_183:2113-2973(+)